MVYRLLMFAGVVMATFEAWLLVTVSFFEVRVFVDGLSVFSVVLIPEYFNVGDRGGISLDWTGTGTTIFVVVDCLSGPGLPLFCADTFSFEPDLVDLDILNPELRNTVGILELDDDFVEETEGDLEWPWLPFEASEGDLEGCAGTFEGGCFPETALLVLLGTGDWHPIRMPYSAFNEFLLRRVSSLTWLLIGTPGILDPWRDTCPWDVLLEMDGLDLFKGTIWSVLLSAEIWELLTDSSLVVAFWIPESLDCERSGGVRKLKPRTRLKEEVDLVLCLFGPLFWDDNEETEELLLASFCLSKILTCFDLGLDGVAGNSVSILVLQLNPDATDVLEEKSGSGVEFVLPVTEAILLLSPGNLSGNHGDGEVAWGEVAMCSGTWNITNFLKKYN